VGVESCEIAVRVTPRARANEVAGVRDGVLLVRVSAPPVDGRATTAACRVIAKRLRVGVRSVSVVRGAGSRDKLVRVEGVGEEELWRALAGPVAVHRHRGSHPGCPGGAGCGGCHGCA
jgi:uncharacterized protein YggU (UPF0235/DUF167 family)